MMAERRPIRFLNPDGRPEGVGLPAEKRGEAAEGIGLAAAGTALAFEEAHGCDRAPLELSSQGLRPGLGQCSTPRSVFLEPGLGLLEGGLPGLAVLDQSSDEAVC